MSMLQSIEVIWRNFQMGQKQLKFSLHKLKSRDSFFTYKFNVNSNLGLKKGK